MQPRQKLGRGATSQGVAVTILLLVLCQSVQMLASGGISLFLPLIRGDVGLSFTQGGMLSAVSSFVYALMQIPSGYLADRFGPRPLFLIGLLGTACMALSFALLHVFWLLVLNQAISGFFRALLFAPGLLLISALFPPQRRATAMGLFVAGGSSSNILLNALGPLLVGPLGWRTLFVGFSLGSIVVAFLYWRLGVQGVTAPAARFTLRDILALFRQRAMLLVAGIQYVRLAVAGGLQFWMPSVLVARGYSLHDAGLIVALGLTITAPANFFGGYISDRLGRPLLVIGISQAMLALSTCLLVQVTQPTLLIPVIVVNGLFVQLYFGPIFNVPLQILGQGAAGVTSGYGNLFANLGGVTFAYLLGAFKDTTGSFSSGLYLLAALCVGGLTCTLTLARMLRAAPG
jgi:MFS family permease